MIIWINGAYGAGKTTISELLHDKIKPSYIYDPENIGDFLRHNLPKEMQKGDFQDHSEWRAWNVHILKKISREYPGDIIAPMTLYKRPVYDEIFTGLKEAKVEVHHFQLEVSKDTIIDRLKERPPELIAWGTERVDEIINAFQKIPSEEKIDNEGKTPAEVAQVIFNRVYNK